MPFYIEKDGKCECPLNCGFMEKDEGCYPCGCSELPLTECGNCKCSTIYTLDYTLTQTKINCAIGETCLELKLFNIDDNSLIFDLKKLPEGDLSFLTTADSTLKPFESKVVNSFKSVDIQFKTDNINSSNELVTFPANLLIYSENGEVNVLEKGTKTTKLEMPDIDLAHLKQLTEQSEVLSKGQSVFIPALEATQTFLAFFSVDHTGLFVSFS